MEVQAGPAHVAPQQLTASLTVGARSIVIRKLGPLDHMRLFELLGGELSENSPYMNLALTAASVASIDGQPEGFPTSKAEVEAMVNRLDFRGLAAVSKAYKDAFGAAESGEPKEIKK